MTGESKPANSAAATPHDHSHHHEPVTTAPTTTAPATTPPTTTTPTPTTTAPATATSAASATTTPPETIPGMSPNLNNPAVAHDHAHHDRSHEGHLMVSVDEIAAEAKKTTTKPGQKVYVRKDIRALTTEEKQQFIQACYRLRENGRWQWYADTHMTAMMSMASPWKNEAPDTKLRNAAHRGPIFCPWHRELLAQLEREMDCAIPYWNWVDDSDDPLNINNPIWQLVGYDGDANDGGLVKSGPFSTDKWQVPDTHDEQGGGIRRELGAAVDVLPTGTDLQKTLQLTVYDTEPWETSSRRSFRNTLEGWRNPAGLRSTGMHNLVHGFIGGHMGGHSGPQDPIFYLHHCYVDKIWEDWMAINKYGPVTLYQPQSGGPEGHNYHDGVWPWGTKISTLCEPSHTLGVVYEEYKESKIAGPAKQKAMEWIANQAAKAAKLPTKVELPAPTIPTTTTSTPTPTKPAAAMDHSMHHAHH